MRENPRATQDPYWRVHSTREAEAAPTRACLENASQKHVIVAFLAVCYLPGGRELPQRRTCNKLSTQNQIITQAHGVVFPLDKLTRTLFSINQKILCKLLNVYMQRARRKYNDVCTYYQLVYTEVFTS